MNPGSDDDVSRALQEKSTLFLITSDAMNVAANEFLQLSRNTHRHWEKLINVERQQRRRLEETVEALGKRNLYSGVHNIQCGSVLTHTRFNAQFL